MKKSFQFMLGFLLLFAFCSVYAQQGALSTGKAPVDNVNSQITYGTFPLASVAYANDNQTSNNLSIPIPDGTPFTIIGSFSGPVFASSMCKGGDGNYYLTDVGPPTQLYLFDPVAGTCTLIGAISGIVSGQEPNGISYDPVTDTYYMVSSADLYSFDLGSMTATLIGAFTPAITGLMIDLCFDENGTCYAYEVNTTAGAANAYTIDLGTAALTTLGYVGFTPNYGQGMSYDMETGTIYLAAFNYDAFAGQLRTMDKATGNTTLVYQWTDQIAPFALDTEYPPVPVELTSFTVNTHKNSVLLNWNTASEVNNHGFEIQRNAGGGFITVGFVRGNGTTTQPHAYSYVDQYINPGHYTYRLKQVDLQGSYSFSSEASVDMYPASYSLEQNYPNPFNPSTQINFNLAADSRVTLKVFNILGQEVTTLLNGNMTAGVHNVIFDASRLTSGVYLYKIEAKGVDGTNFTSIKKMILTK